MAGMKAGVGCSTAAGTESAVREAYRCAEAASGKPRISLVFTAGSYESADVWRTMRELAGGALFAGFQCGGVLTRDGLLEQGIGIATISGDLSVATVLDAGLSEDPWAAGERAGRSLLEKGPETGLVVVLPDGVPPGTYDLVRSLYGQMGPDFQYIGGGSGDSLKFLPTCQFTEAAVHRNAVAAAVFGGCEARTAIGHGWQPHGAPLVITRAEGKRVLELDGRPAFQVFCEALDIQIPRESFRRFSMVNPFGFVDISGDYVIRDPRALNDDDSLEFVTEVPNKAVALLMRGDVEGLIETARGVAARAVAEVGTPRLALAFDCISRFILMGNGYSKELQALVDGIGPGVPLLGALTFGEIGSYHDVPLFHNKTVAVAVLGDA